MAALKFLALAVQVRILVSQPQTKPTLSGPASAFLIGIVFCLRVTVGAQKLQIRQHIILMIAINVVDLKDQGFTVPILYSTSFTSGFPILDTFDILLFQVPGPDS